MRRTTTLLAVPVLTLISWAAHAAPYAHEVSPLTIAVGPMDAGTTVDIDITGAQSYEQVYVMQSTSGEGAGPCPPLLGGLCLELVDASILATPWSEIDGSAVRPFNVPDADGIEICFQAAVLRGAGNAHTELSNVTCRTILTDSDGDGVPDSDDLCEGFDDALDADADGVPDGCDPFPDCPTEDLGCGCGEPAPSTWYEDADGDGVGAGEPVLFCEDEVPVGESCSSLPYVELVGGDVEVPVDCAPGDYDCQAKAVCEFATGLECIYQTYDCATGSNGSYYPVGTPGGSNFNFAINYDFSPVGNIVEEGGTYGGYGNICCSPDLCDDFGIRKDHTSAGYGHWGLDADGIGALSGLGCSSDPLYVAVDGDPCPDDPTDSCAVTCNSMPYVELVGGDVWVPLDCAPGDYDCQAKAVCEFATGLECIYQTYDCVTGSNGSYYPVGTPGGSNFNFAINYDFSPVGNIVEEGGTYGGYGNICCSPDLCDDFGIRKDHTSAGYGHWGLDADGVECL